MDGDDAPGLARARAVAATLAECGKAVTVRDVQRLAGCRSAVAAQAVRETEAATPLPGTLPEATAMLPPLGPSVAGELDGQGGVEAETPAGQAPFVPAPPEEPPLPWGEVEETAAAADLARLAWRRRALRALPWAIAAGGLAVGVSQRQALLGAIHRAWVGYVYAPVGAAAGAARSAAASATAAGLRAGVAATQTVTRWAWVPRVDGLSPRAEGLILAGLALAMVPGGSRLARLLYLGALLAAAGLAAHLLQPFLGAAQGALAGFGGG